MLETALITSLVTNFIQIVGLFVAIRRQSRKDTIAEYERLLARYQAQANRHDAQFIAHERMIRVLSGQCNDCNVEFAEFHGFVDRLYDICKRLSNHIQELGGVPENVPVLPRRKKRKQLDIEFMLRESEQVKVFGRASDEKDREVMEEERGGLEKKNENSPD